MNNTLAFTTTNLDESSKEQCQQYLEAGFIGESSYGDGSAYHTNTFRVKDGKRFIEWALTTYPALSVSYYGTVYDQDDYESAFEGDEEGVTYEDEELILVVDGDWSCVQKDDIKPSSNDNTFIDPSFIEGLQEQMCDDAVVVLMGVQAADSSVGDITFHVIEKEGEPRFLNLHMMLRQVGALKKRDVA